MIPHDIARDICTLAKLPVRNARALRMMQFKLVELPLRPSKGQQERRSSLAVIVKQGEAAGRYAIEL